MTDVVICEPLRTPVGKFGGVFRDVTAVELGATVVRALLDRTGVPPEQVDDVVLGHCNSSAEAPAIGRVVALEAGLPVSVPGQQVDRRCGSGLQAVLQAATAVRAGDQELVVSGGTESMSNASFYSLDLRWGHHGHSALVDSLVRARQAAGGPSRWIEAGMLETAENLRREYAITRAHQDELAAESHHRAARAQETDRFADEIVPVMVGHRVVDRDEHIRADTTPERLSRLTPILWSTDPDATVTAGNASGQNDGAAACIVTTPARAAQLGVPPLARLVSWAVAGVEPARMGLGPIPATELALSRAGLGLHDMDLIELNEAFAAQVLAVLREWRLTPADRDRVNVLGSGISLGHPVGATGARMLATAARELDRRDAHRALLTLCIGGGQGLAAVIERVAT